MKKTLLLFFAAGLMVACGAEKEESKEEKKSEDKKEEAKEDTKEEEPKIPEDYEVNVPADIQNACDCNTLYIKEETTLLGLVDNVSEGELSANEDLQEKVKTQLQRFKAIKKQCDHIGVENEDLSNCVNYEEFDAINQKVKAILPMIEENVPMD